MSVVGMVVHRERDEAALLAMRAAAWLADRGHTVRLPAEDADIAGLASATTASRAASSTAPPHAPAWARR